MSRVGGAVNRVGGVGSSVGGTCEQSGWGM